RTRPLLSRSAGAPYAAVSSGKISVSNVAAKLAYSASVKPPAGASESTAMIADFETAAMRAVWFRRLVHASLLFVFIWKYVPSAVVAGRLRIADRFAEARCMPRIRGPGGAAVTSG